jgi:hypothetical protein
MIEYQFIVEDGMYSELTPAEQILLAIEFHLLRATIPEELQELLGPEVIADITYHKT